MWLRRAATIPTAIALGLAIVLLLPLLLAAALAVDLLRRNRFAFVRLVAFGAVYGAAGIAGLAASLALWIAGGPWRGADRQRWLAWNFALQAVWARALLGAACAIYSLDVVVEGADRAAPGPVLVFPRHASLVDILLPCVKLSGDLGLHLRWVLKRELLVDPCLDVAGHRLPNVFVDRNAAQSKAEIDAVARLALGMGPRDGVLLYPEGTRSTPAKRARALERIAAAGQTVRRDRLGALRHLLPPRTGGPLALLEAAPDADVVILGHAGLDGFAEVRDLLSGGIVGRTVVVRCWRHAAASVPREREAALAWLDARWLELDRWVGEQRSAQTPA